MYLEDHPELGSTRGCIAESAPGGCNGHVCMLCAPPGHFGITEQAADACVAPFWKSFSTGAHEAAISRGCYVGCMRTWTHANEGISLSLHRALLWTYYEH